MPLRHSPSLSRLEEGCRKKGGRGVDPPPHGDARCIDLPNKKNLFLLPSYVQQCTGKEKEEGEERGGHNQGLPPPLSLFRPFPPSALTKCLPGLEIEKGRKHYPCLVLPLLFFSSPELNRAWLQSGGTERERGHRLLEKRGAEKRGEGGETRQRSSSNWGEGKSFSPSLRSLPRLCTIFQGDGGPLRILSFFFFDATEVFSQGAVFPLLR